LQGSGTHTIELTEKVAAARNPSAGPDRWEFSEISVSGFFTFGLTDVWHLRVQDDYYDSFWAGILDALRDHHDPVEIHVYVDYVYGSETEDTIKQYMREWVHRYPGFLTVREPDEAGSFPSFVHMHYRGFEIKPLEVSV
jgi:hypothetical protein